MLNEYECWRCGAKIQFDDEPHERVYCEGCKKEAIREHNDLVEQYSKLKIRVMVDIAIRKMERAGMYMHEYLDVSKEISGEIDECPSRYLSADEVIAAMVLKSYGIGYEPNKRVGDFVVDFYIPEMCVCLEIDGDRHEMNTIRDSKRDITIRQQLGAQWEIIRIKTNYLEKNPEKLVDAIEAIYEQKKKLRKENNGIIPEYFSRREKDLYASVAQWKKVNAKRWNR